MPEFVNKPGGQSLVQQSQSPHVAGVGVPGKVTLVMQQAARRAPAARIPAEESQTRQAELYRASTAGASPTPNHPDPGWLRAQYQVLVATARAGLISPAAAIESFTQFDRELHGGRLSPTGVQLLVRMPVDIANPNPTKGDGSAAALPRPTGGNAAALAADGNAEVDPEIGGPASETEEVPVKPGAPDWRAMAHTLERSARQLELASARLADWKLNYHLGKAIRWVDKHRDVLTATPDATLEKWAPIIAEQSATLFEAGGDIGTVVAQAQGRGVRSDAPEAAPFRDVLEKFAEAMGEAHLEGGGRMELASARRAQAQLPLELLDQSLRVNRKLTRDMVEVVPSVKDEFGVNRVEDARVIAYTLEATAWQLQRTSNAGGGIDPAMLNSLEISADEQRVVLRTAILDAKIDKLADATREATDGLLASGANLFNDEIDQIRDALHAVKFQAADIVPTMRREAIPEGPFPADPVQGQRMFAQARIESVAHAKAAWARLGQEHQLDSLLRRAVRTIETAYHNTRYLRLVVDIAEMIGIAVLSEGIATVASGAARSAILGGAAVDTVEFARTAALARGVGTATALTTDVVVQSLGQMVVDGHSSFGEAALTNVITLGALRPFHAWVGKLGQFDAETRGLWKLASGGKVIVAETGKFTVETLVGAGASYVATRMVEGKAPPDSLTAASWAAQGASMAVGKFIHGRMRDLNERWAKIGEEKIALLKRARHQEQLADNVQRSGSTEEALQVLDAHAEIIQAERALLSDPVALARLGLDSQQMAVLHRGNTAAIADTQTQAYGFIRLRFLGLEPLTSVGDVWTGTRAQIDVILADGGGAVRDVAPAGEGQWTARMAGERITFVEVSHRSRSNHAPPSPREAEANRALAAEARKINALRSQRLTELVYATDHPKFAHITVGEGVAAALSHSSQTHGSGVKPGAIEEPPQAIAISDHPDWWGILGDREAGQPVTDWSSTAYRWQPGAFNSDHKGLGRASDVANANAMTALEAGMVVVRGRVTEVEAFKDGATWPVAAKWRLKLDGKKWVYADTVAYGGGLGVPREVAGLAAVEPAMRQAGRLVYAQDKLIPDISAGSTLVIFGDSGTAGWAAQDAIAAGYKVKLVVGDPAMPKMPSRLRDFIAKHNIEISLWEQIDNVAWSGQNLSFTVGNRFVEVQGVSVAIGQTTVLPKGMDELHLRMVTDPGIHGDDRVVALESFDPSTKKSTGLLVQGSAMTATPFKQSKMVQDVDLYRRRLANQANSPDVPLDSRGVEPSIYQSARNIPASNQKGL